MWQTGLQLQPSSPALDVQALFQFCCDLPRVTQEENFFSEPRAESGIFIVPHPGLFQ